MASIVKNAPTCKCGKPMVLRTVSGGLHEGRRYWGCSDYPNCHERGGVITEAIDPGGKIAKKVYEKPAIVDIEELISENFKLFRETAEHVTRERCPSGCKVIVDRVTDKDCPRVRALFVFSFKLGDWSFEHQEAWILWDPWDPNGRVSDAMVSRANQQGLDRSLNLFFDRAARELMKFHSRKEAGR